MNLQVRIGDETFQVEVGDLRARPIIAHIDGAAFEVWPESGQSGPLEIPAPATNGRHDPPTTLPAGLAGAIRAPIPGVILAIAVQEGATVAAGQEICTLEAMKMQNTIRAPYAGRIGRIAIAVGQAVQHQDVLVEFVA